MDIQITIEGTTPGMKEYLRTFTVRRTFKDHAGDTVFSFTSGHFYRSGSRQVVTKTGRTAAIDCWIRD